MPAEEDQDRNAWAPKRAKLRPTPGARRIAAGRTERKHPDYTYVWRARRSSLTPEQLKHIAWADAVFF